MTCLWFEEDYFLHKGEWVGPWGWQPLKVKKIKRKTVGYGITCLCSENVSKNSNVYYAQVILHSLYTSYKEIEIFILRKQLLFGIKSWF